MHFSCREELCAEHCSFNWKYGSIADFDFIKKTGLEINEMEPKEIMQESQNPKSKVHKLYKDLNTAINNLQTDSALQVSCVSV